MGDSRNLLNFLLPSSNLDWMFFIILLVWFCISLFAAYKALRSVEVRVKAHHFKNINSESASDLALMVKHPLWDHITESAPGFSMILGLLGTFLGIGLAINHAGLVLGQLSQSGAEVSDIAVAIGNLRPMLAEIGLKFKCSAWGILTHIALRIAIPWFGAEEKRLEYISKELISDWQDKDKKEEERWARLNLSIKENGQALREIVLLNKQFISIQNNTVEQLKDISVHTIALKDFKENMKEFEGQVANFSKAINNFKVETTGAVNRMNEEMGGAVRNMQENVSGVISDFKENMSFSVNGITNVVCDMNKTIKDTFDGFRVDVTGTLKKIGSDISKSSGHITEEVNKLSVIMKEMEESLNVQLEKLDGGISHLKEIASQSATVHTQMAEQNLTQQKIVVSMKNEMDKVTQNGAKYANSMSDGVNAIAGLFSEKGEFLGHIKESSSATKDMSKNITKLVQTLSSKAGHA